MITVRLKVKAKARSRKTNGLKNQRSKNILVVFYHLLWGFASWISIYSPLRVPKFPFTLMFRVLNLYLQSNSRPEISIYWCFASIYFYLQSTSPQISIYSDFRVLGFYLQSNSRPEIFIHSDLSRPKNRPLRGRSTRIWRDANVTFHFACPYAYRNELNLDRLSVWYISDLFDSDGIHQTSFLTTNYWM